MTENKSLLEFKAIEAARKTYNISNSTRYSQRTSLRRAFKVYQQKLAEYGLDKT